MKQTIGNACGTIALLHAVCNSVKPPAAALEVARGSFLEKFLLATQPLSPEERGSYLERPPPGAPSLDAFHHVSKPSAFRLLSFLYLVAPSSYCTLKIVNCCVEVQEAAQQGSTAAPEATEDVDLHFNSFVLDDQSHVWELDGRMPGPIEHGTSSPETLLHDVARIVQRDFVEKSNSYNFSVLALAPST